MVVRCALAAVTYLGSSPLTSLLMFSRLLLGCASSLGLDPDWQAIQPEVIPREQ